MYSIDTRGGEASRKRRGTYIPTGFEYMEGSLYLFMEVVCIGIATLASFDICRGLGLRVAA